jgi:hypothetical protein
MDTTLQPVVSALAELEEHELHGLIQTVNGLPQMAAGLFAWIEHIADWEINRRTGVQFPLLAPVAAIPPEEDAQSISAALMMREFVAGELDSGDPLVALFESIVGVLTGRERLQ